MVQSPVSFELSSPGADSVHTLTCAIMLLNTDLHGQVRSGEAAKEQKWGFGGWGGEGLWHEAGREDRRLGRISGWDVQTVPLLHGHRTLEKA